MIINQTGGSGWNHYTKTITDKYVSGHYNESEFSIGECDKVLVCGTVYFLKSDDTIEARGKFYGWVPDPNGPYDSDIYLIDKVSSGTKTAKCGYFDVATDLNMNRIIMLTVEHSSLVKDAVTVKIVIDAFWT